MRHVARHGLTPAEVAEAFADPQRREVSARDVHSEERHALLGATLDGRVLLVVYTWRAEIFGSSPLGTLVERSGFCTARKQPMPRKKMLPVERTDIPDFANEDEEDRFWATHELGPGLLSEMRPNGDRRLPSPDEVRAHLERTRSSAHIHERSQPIAIRWDVDMLRRLRALAARKHVGYQTLMKQFVGERLYEEEKREGLL